MKLSVILSAAALCTAASLAHADITTYTDRASFLALLSAPGTDTYDDLLITPLQGPLNRLAGPYAYQAATGPHSSLLYGGGTPGGDAWLTTNNLYDAITFSGFTPGVNAVGGEFFGTDSGGQWQEGTSVVVHATDGVDTVSYLVNGATPSSFVGFASTRGLVTVSVDSAGHYWWPTANNLTLGQVCVVPEPHSYAMLLAGLLSLGALAQRRAHRR